MTGRNGPNPLLDAVRAKQPDVRIKQLEKLVAQQADTIDQLRGKGWKRPPIAKPKKTEQGLIRAIIPDSHGCHIEWDAARAALRDIERLRPAEVVLLGDHLDCGGWLAQHHVLGFVPETTYCFEDDISATNQFLDEVQAAAPGAAIYYLEGNHEHRVSKQIIKLCLGKTKDCEMMQRTWGCQAVLHLAKRGIKWVGREEKHNANRRGTIKLGHCYFTHGRRTGPHAAHNTLRQFKKNVCFGHTHRVALAAQESADEPVLAAWSFGCLCQLSPLYYDTDPTDWQHGYGVQVVAKDGTFSTIQSLILDGRSLMANLLELLK